MMLIHVTIYLLLKTHSQIISKVFKLELRDLWSLEVNYPCCHLVDGQRDPLTRSSWRSRLTLLIVAFFVERAMVLYPENDKDVIMGDEGAHLKRKSEAAKNPKTSKPLPRREEQLP
jgi:hypothetical protein